MLTVGCVQRLAELEGHTPKPLAYTRVPAYSSSMGTPQAPLAHLTYSIHA